MGNIIDKNEKELPVTKYIYYFSGTGNSYYIAKTIADIIGAVLKPIVSLKKREFIEAEILCFVFPIYEFKPPKKVTEIVESFSGIRANYIIAIATYGVALSSALNHFNDTLKKKGAVLSCGYGIKSPQNAVGSIGFTDEENNKRILNADIKISVIIENIQSGKSSDPERTSIFEDLTIIKHIPCILKLLYILIIKGPKALRYTITPECVRCYQCIKICPVANIELAEGRLEFGNNCAGCFACIQWCPKSAIHLGKYSFEELYLKHYHHPKVKAVDLISDRSMK